MPSSLVLTKLYRPSLPPKYVRRPHLTRRLNEGLAAGRPITLVSAPAGFGKTTCISEWLSELDMPVAWLSLDPSDDDPGRFFTYLVAALQKADGALGRELERALRSGQLPPSEVISTTIINDILALDGRFLLVLDDFQVIQDRSILQMMEALVANPPPALHLVLITREDPSLSLARVRANNQLTEIRGADLRFAPPEAARFLNEVMDLSLSPADIALLEERTEGWIAGLQLAGLAVQAASSTGDRAGPSRFIANLSGSHRFILAYLTEEVLGRQPEEIQEFLLQTSILDRLSGELCDAVTGRTGGRLLLERLYNANLFLMPLDDEGHWYRTHQLFAGYLRDLQRARQPGQTVELHRRASRWYAQAGMAGEAIRHAQDGADYEAAVQLLEKHAVDMLMQWHVKTVDQWLRAIPPEWAALSPRTNLAFAWLHLQRGDLAQAVPYLERLEVMFADPQLVAGDASLKAEWLALQSMLLFAQGEPAESLMLARQAQEIVPEKDHAVRTQIYVSLGAAYQQMNDYPRAVEAYQMLIQHGRASESLPAEMMGISALGLMALQRGQLHFAFELASQGVERLERAERLGPLPPISAAVFAELGQVYYQWHQLEQARAYFLRSVEASGLSGYSDAQLYYAVIRSRLYEVQGDLDAAAEEIQKAVDLMRLEAPAAVLEQIVTQQIRVYLAQNRLAAAEAALKRHGFSSLGDFAFPDLASSEGVGRPPVLLLNSALRTLLYRARARREPAILKRGIELADSLIAAVLPGQYIPIALETLLLRAQMHAALGDDEANVAASLADCARALELAEPEGFITVFVEEGPPIAEAMEALLDGDQLGAVEPSYVRNILAAFSAPRPPAAASVQPPGPASPPAPLTGRELEVLRLMAEGQTYKEIASALYISLNTVRSHVKAIYGKLDVDNRTQAIEAARQRQIL